MNTQNIQTTTTTYTFENSFIKIIKKLFQKYFFYEEGELCDIHIILNTLPKNEREDIMRIKNIGFDRNNLFLNDFYHFVDNDPLFFEIYKTFIIKYIKPLFKDEIKILYQTTPNLRISFPNSTAIGRTPNDDINSNIIGVHKDSDFGHSIEEVNFIIPITKMFDTNSIYHQRETGSREPLEEYCNIILNTDQFLMAKFSQLYHYNRINTTGKTRLSLDFRVIPFSKYNNSVDNTMSLSAKKKLILGEYFSLI